MPEPSPFLHTSPDPAPRRSRKWLKIVLIAFVALLGLCVIGVFAGAQLLERRVSPMARARILHYLRERFDSDAQLGSLKVTLPEISPIRMIFERGRGTVAHIEVRDVLLHYRGRQDLPPLLKIAKADFGIDVGTITGPAKTLPLVTIEGLDITIPPKDQRTPDPHPAPAQTGSTHGGVTVEKIDIRNARLRILSTHKGKDPLEFNIYSLILSNVTRDEPMRFQAALTNPKPSGVIHATGSFGPWQGEEPGDTPLNGDYLFGPADMGVFQAISGKLSSQGHFAGQLDSITATGTATVPDFSLKSVGNPVPLTTRFEVLVDGRNGNTVLKPVVARLGSTNFTTAGAVIRKEGDLQRTISLNVEMPDGDAKDVTRLGMKGPPFLDGRIRMTHTRIEIPAEPSRVKEKLLLSGDFAISDGKFLRSGIEDQIDTLSRRGQGQPRNMDIDEVLFRMQGKFDLDHELLTLNALRFDVPGAGIALDGTYNLGTDVLDFHGGMKLEAKVSQTMTGWKRWALKPVDPFFAKNGAGTFLKIKVVGTSREPKFGHDSGGGSQDAKAGAGAGTVRARH